MLFNSISFAIFLPIVFFLYWFIAGKSLRLQNLLLLFASYYFYACWDYRFLFLLMFSTFLDYYTGIRVQDSVKQRDRKFWFWLSIIVNLGFLGVFKYYNFFAESFSQALGGLGLKFNSWSLQIILPVGISFYTFHGLSYVIDIYKERIQPERNFVNYSLFVSFFPLLVAGPIERATHLLPQIQKNRTFNYTLAIEGLRQIIWGLFKKIVVADNCAQYVNLIFNDYESVSASSLLYGGVLFAFQIYGDFSGYSDIALGTARLLGFDLLKNFSYPYFSRDIAEFWRRWHISLSSWFRDYLYVPLGGSKGGTWVKIRNTFIIFIVSGFWHGANWTFIFWGFLNALYFLPLLIRKRNRQNMEIVAKGRNLPSTPELLNMVSTFALTVIAWIFFRSETLGDAFGYLQHMFSISIIAPLDFGSALDVKQSYVLVLLIIFFVLVEWLGREKPFAISMFAPNWKKSLRWGFYGILVFIIGMYMQTEETPFIYFQF